MTAFGPKAVKAALLRRALAKYTYLKQEYGGHGYLESTYQHLFLRELKRHGLEDLYTPIQSAANYSLLFILLATVAHVQPASVLELGCGETTVLLNALLQAGVWRGKLTSLEHDSFWHEQIAATVATDVVYAPLTDRVICGRHTRAYDLSDLKASHGAFDLVLVDGPNGVPRCSRLTCLDFIPERLAQDFVIIFDDYERPGEKETAALARRALESRGVRFGEEVFLSSKHQLMIATDRYRPCLFPRVREAAR